MKVTTTQRVNNRTGAAEMQPANIARILEPGTDLQVAEIVSGQEILGNDQWLKLTDGSFVWTGGTNYLGDYPWWIADNDIPDFWPKTTGAGVKVALLDTGIDQHHPAFGSQVIKAAYTASSPNIPDGDGSDLKGHGTGCAGILIGHDPKLNKNCCGVAPQSDIYSYCVFNAQAGDKPAFLVQGLQAAIADNVHIISISRNILFSAAVKAAIEIAIKNKIFVVVCSGSPGQPNPLLNAAGVVKVSAIAQDQSDQLPAGGPVNPIAAVTCYAPGINIRTTSMDNLYTQQPASGTSFATPFIAGALALKIQLHDPDDRSYYDSIWNDLNNAIAPNAQNHPVLNLKQFIT